MKPIDLLKYELKKLEKLQTKELEVIDARLKKVEKDAGRVD